MDVNLNNILDELKNIEKDEEKAKLKHDKQVLLISRKNIENKFLLKQAMCQNNVLPDKLSVVDSQQNQYNKTIVDKLNIISDVNIFSTSKSELKLKKKLKAMETRNFKLIERINQRNSHNK